jgi:hypothetical protein
MIQATSQTQSSAEPSKRVRGSTASHGHLIFIVDALQMSCAGHTPDRTREIALEDSVLDDYLR